MTMRPYLDVILDPLPAYTRALLSLFDRPMTMSSDGAAAVLVDGDCDGQTSPHASISGIASALVAQQIKAANVPREHLPRAMPLSALVAALQQSLGPCRTCGDRRRILADALKPCKTCEGTAEVECSECGHDRGCDACIDGFVPVGDGSKVEEHCPCTLLRYQDGSTQAVTLDGVAFNAALAAGDLQRLPTQEQRIRVGGAGGAFVVRGVGWCFVLIGLSNGNKAKPLDLPGVQP